MSLKLIIFLTVLILGFLITNEVLSARNALYVVNPVATSTPQAPIKPVVKRKYVTPVPTAEQVLLIQQKAEQYNVSAEVMTKVIACESGFKEDVQSRHITRNGTREESYGLAQWHLPSGNTKQDGTVITKADALNPEIAVDLMAWYFSEGKASKWSCYNHIYGKS